MITTLCKLIFVIPEKAGIPSILVNLECHSREEPAPTRRASLILKELCKGNFEEIPLSKKARNELRRWFN